MASYKQKATARHSQHTGRQWLPPWRQTGASYQGLMTLIGQQTAPRLDRGLDDGGGTANGVRPTENERGDTGKQPHT